MAEKKKSQGPAFSEEERAAMAERAKEVRAERSGKRDKKADAEAALLEKIEAMADDDRKLATKVHELVRANAPDLEPKLWYGMPAYARDGKVVCFFQDAGKFKARYATLGFNDSAMLDDGSFWPTAYALTKWSAANEKAIAALIRKAAG